MTEPTQKSNDLPEKCPKCGSKTIFGYGLAGGGMGPYVMCDGPDNEDGSDSAGCDFFMKRQSEPDGE